MRCTTVRPASGTSHRGFTATPPFWRNASRTPASRWPRTASSTPSVSPSTPAGPRGIQRSAAERGINLGRPSGDRLHISLDETTGGDDVRELLRVFGVPVGDDDPVAAAAREARPHLPEGYVRQSGFLEAEVFNQHIPRPDAALHGPASGQGPESGAVHDTAGFLHHEAQRHRRDDSRDVAGVRPGCIPSRPRTRPVDTAG